tara:strand:- start:264 stop:665 length:402 start_codon:yes stop_codon:yes gene_type:complete
MADMWTDLGRWEEDNHAVVFLVVDTQELREQFSYWNAFDIDHDDFICDVEDVSENIMTEALKNAYNRVDLTYAGLQDVYDVSYDYVVSALQARIHDSIKAKREKWTRGNLWNSETKEFDKVKDFMKQRQTELF